MKKHSQGYPRKCFIFSVPARARTVDPLIKSQLLYQLSYRDNFQFGRQNYGIIDKPAQKFGKIF